MVGLCLKFRQTTDELSEPDALKLSINNKSVKVADLFTLDVHDYNLPVFGDERSMVIPTAKPE